MKSYQAFFAELKRRHVFKVTAVYGAAAFVLLQVAELLGQGLRLPESFMPFMTAVILLGFPLALILAWAFEITPEGVQKTEEAAPGVIEALVAEPASKRWPAGMLAVLGVAALLAGTWWAGRQSVPGADDGDIDRAARSADVQLAALDPADDPRPSIAVLPFVNMSDEEQQEYFSDGMTEEILNTLAKLRELRVAARTSAFAYKGRSTDLREVGNELGVGYLLEGSVRKAGDQLRITAQLIDVSDGSHVWNEQYDRTLDDVFAIQSDIARAIADELRVPLGLADDGRLVSPTGDLEAYDLYLAGRSRMRERGTSLIEARRLFQAAISRDSTWAPAWAALAEATEISIWHGEAFGDRAYDSISVAEFITAADRAARRALELDHDNASALVALGSVERDRGNWAEAETTYRRALSLDPDNAEAHQQYGELLREVGRLDESVRALDRAAALDPAPVRMGLLMLSLRLDDRIEEALAVARLGMELDSEMTFADLWGGAAEAYAQAGRWEEAERIGTRLIERYGLPPWVDPDDVSPETVVGEWLRVLEGEGDVPVPDGIASLMTAENWMHLGEPDSAMAAIQRTGLLGYLGLPGATSFWYPALDPLRSDPRFLEMMERTRAPRTQPIRTPPGERTRPIVLRGGGDGP